MARVTVEDCILKIPNRFDLVISAAKRARDITAGIEVTVEKDNDKNPIIALREIADGDIDFDLIKENIIKDLQRVHEDNTDDEELDEMFEKENLGPSKDNIGDIVVSTKLTKLQQALEGKADVIKE